MSEVEPSLVLEMDFALDGGEKVAVARIAVVNPRSVTRDGSAQVITVDCPGPTAFDREVARLHAEIDAARREAAAKFGADAAPAPGTAEPAAKSPADARPAPRVALDASVADVMTREVHSVERNAPLAQVAALLQEKRCRHVVVVDEAGALAGVVSQRDIYFGPLAWSLGQGRHAYESALDQTLVKSVMQANVRTIESEAPLQQAAHEMLERKIGCLPVVDGGKLVGIVTESDLLELLG